jgi:MFS family permease
MPNLPFLLAFATASLHWRSYAIGMIAALPHICNLLQPSFSRYLERRYSLRSIMQWGFVFSAIPWFFVGLSAHLGNFSDASFALLLTVATMANSVTSVAWSAAISEVVPTRISGTYFGRRNLVFGAWTLIAVLLAGKIVDWSPNHQMAFYWIFACAGSARLAGLFFLSKMKFPPSVTEHRAASFTLTEILRPLSDPNYRRYMLFVGFWGLFLNMGLPFYTVYLIRFLKFHVGQTIVIGTIATLGGIATLKSWGALADLFGSKPVQYVCAYAWIFIGCLGWAVSGPKLWWHLYLVFLIVGGATAGFQLAQFNLMLKLIPTGMGSLYIAVFLAVTSALTAIGPLLGGTVLALLPSRLGSIMGQPFLNYHLVFIFSFMGCLLSLPLLTSSQEPSSAEVQRVWRSMWRMRSFNPLLAINNAAGFLFTPRGILSFSKYSVRSLRREVRKVVEVGAELVGGGQALLRERPEPGKDKG